MRKLLICLGLLAAMAPAAWSQQAPEQGSSVSDEVIQQVLEPLRSGVESHNLQSTLSVFDPKEVTGYSDLQGRLRAFFQQFDEVRLRYQLLQVSSDQDRASAVAEMDMDAQPYDVTQLPVRRSVRMRLQLKHEAKAWKIVAFSPGDFFDVEYSAR